MDKWPNWNVDDCQPILWSDGYWWQGSTYVVLPQLDLYATIVERVVETDMTESETTVFAIQWLLERGWTVGRRDAA